MRYFYKLSNNLLIIFLGMIISLVTEFYSERKLIVWHLFGVLGSVVAPSDTGIYPILNWLYTIAR